MLNNKIKNSDIKFMKFAIKKAKQGIAKGQAPFAACITKQGIIISQAHNLVWKNTDITAHAEIQTIRKACRNLKTIDLSSCTIYSTCEPCPMCFSACHWAKISRIVYGTRIEDAKKIGFSELAISNRKMKRLGNSSLEIIEDFLRKENLQLFKLWSRQKYKRRY